MNRLTAICFFTGILILSISCSNELDLTAEWEDTPIVYGLLSRQDTAHYIKIEKAFLDPTESALDIAQIPDSLYYDNLVVRVEHIRTGKIYNLSMVDGNLEGYPKEEGTFADAPNYLYKFKLAANEELVEGDSYQLLIDRGDDKPTVVAQDVIVSDLTVTSPFPGTNLKILYRDFPVQWKSEDDARIFDLQLVFNYWELDPAISNVYVPKTVVWTVAKNIFKELDGSTQTKYDLPGVGLYQFLAAELVTDPNITRNNVSIEFIVKAGGEALYEYINIGQANTGITSSQVIPTYTNLSEGFGVFSSVNDVISDPFTVLNNEMEDSIQYGIYTEKLNFQF